MQAAASTTGDAGTSTPNPLAAHAVNQIDASAIEASTADPASLPEAGVYHLPDQVDAVNFELSTADSTFRWGVSGCDYLSGDSGRLRVEGDRIVLSADGEFTWFHGISFANRVTEVSVRRAPEPGVVLVSGVIRGEAFEQRWVAGGVCPVCGGQLGPTGQNACQDPYLGEWFQIIIG